MRIAVLSDCRVPTTPAGGHGLGHLALDVARGLRIAGHDVTLFAGPGSHGFDAIVIHDYEDARAHAMAKDSAMSDWDALVDLSHYHTLSKVRPDLPVLNYIVDYECGWQPPNAAVVNEYSQLRHPSARIIPLGIDVDNVPFGTGERNYYAYAAKIHHNKGIDIAINVAKALDKPTRFVGEKMLDIHIPNLEAPITDVNEFYAFLGGAIALLSPYRHCAGGRVNLEAAACGTPVLCLDGTGTRYHINHCVSGFVCVDTQDMIDAVADIPLLDRQAMRDWVYETHDISVMTQAIVDACDDMINGRRW